MANAYSVTNKTGIYYRTTDGTFATVGTHTLATDTAVVIKATIVAMRTSAAEAAGYVIYGTFKNAAGTVAQVGTTTSVVSNESDSSFNIQFLVSGTGVAVQVQGNPGKIVNWRVDLEVLGVGLEAEYT